MAQKARPDSIRLGLTLPWQSRWFFKKSIRFFVQEDCLIRDLINKKLRAAGIASVEIERIGTTIKVAIKASRPGLIIGRGGKGIEELKDELLKKLRKLHKDNGIKDNFALNLNIEELRRSEISASVVAGQVAFDIEKRLPYRRVIKHYLELARQNREILGAKIRVGGRLDGAEISRCDWLANGRMPLQNLRANIDYGEATAFNSYGTVGIKVWLYKGEVFDEVIKS